MYAANRFAGPRHNGQCSGNGIPKHIDRHTIRSLTKRKISIQTEIISHNVDQINRSIVWVFRQSYGSDGIRFGASATSGAENQSRKGIRPRFENYQCISESKIIFIYVQVGPILFKCTKSNITISVLIALNIIKQFFEEENQYFQNHFQHFMANCIDLCAYKASMVGIIFDGFFVVVV